MNHKRYSAWQDMESKLPLWAQLTIDRVRYVLTLGFIR